MQLKRFIGDACPIESKVKHESENLLKCQPGNHFISHFNNNDNNNNRTTARNSCCVCSIQQWRPRARDTWASEWVPHLDFFHLINATIISIKQATRRAGWISTLAPPFHNNLPINLKRRSTSICWLKEYLIPLNIFFFKHRIEWCGLNAIAGVGCCATNPPAGIIRTG